MRIVNAFSVFGDDPDGIYIPGMVANAYMYQKYRPQDKIVVYAGKTAHEELSDHLTGKNVDIRLEEGPEDQTATFWRFQAIRDYDADYYFFRDADSRPIQRQRLAESDFMVSRNKFHVIRDHDYHCVPMLAGMWGCSILGARKISGVIPRGWARARPFYGTDQLWLKAMVWPMAKNDVYASVDCRWEFEVSRQRHPIEGDLSEGFVGMGFNGDNTPRRPEHNRPGFVGVRA